MPACMCYRVIKQVLHSSGANVTEKHIKEVSLSGLFLMEEAKKADIELLVLHHHQQDTR